MDVKAAVILAKMRAHQAAGRKIIRKLARDRERREQDQARERELSCLTQLFPGGL